MSLFFEMCWSRVCLSEPLPRIRPLYALYCLLMLIFVSVLDQADRWALPTLQAAGLQCSSCGEPDDSFYEQCMDHCLDFTDVQMGLLTGPAFSVSAVVVAAPLGWIADRYSRVRLLLAGLVIWSLATLASAFIQEYWQLLVLRIGLGIGQATVNPTAYSLLSDFFVPQRRALVMAAFSSMVYVGQVVGLMTGIIAQYSSWRVAFFLLGTPGVALAVPIFLTVFEPKRGGMDRAKAPFVAIGGGTEVQDVEAMRTTQDKAAGGVALGAAAGATISRSKDNRSGDEDSGEGIADEDRGKSIEDDGDDLHESDHGDCAVEYGDDSVISPSPHPLHRREGSYEFGGSAATGGIIDSVDEVTIASQHDGLRQLWGNIRSLVTAPWFAMLFVSAVTRFLAGYGLGSWIQVFYRRVYGLSPTSVSLWMSVVVPVGGLGGAYTGGWVADYWSERSRGGKAFMCALCSIIAAPIQATCLLVSDSTVSFLLLLASYFFAEMWYGPAVAIVQDNVDPTLRSLATALYLVSGAFGALSPLIIGIMNDTLAIEIDATPVASTTQSVADAYDPTIPLLVMVPGMYVVSSVLFGVTGFLLLRASVVGIRNSGPQ